MAIQLRIGTSVIAGEARFRHIGDSCRSEWTLRLQRKPF